MAPRTKIEFSQLEQENAHRLSDGDAQEIVKLGVLNTESEDWQKLSTQRQQEILDEIAAKFEPRKGLIEEIKAGAQSSGESQDNGESGSQESEKRGEVPKDIKSAADAARAQVKATFGEIGSKDYRVSMSAFREYILQHFPTFDISGADDLADAMYQPRTRIEQVIDALEKAGGETGDSIGLPNKYVDNELLNKAFSAIGLSTITDKELNNPEKRKAAIIGMLKQITKKMEGRKASDWEVTTLISDTWWAGMMVLGSWLGLWKVPGMFTNALLSKIPFVGKHIAGASELKRGEGVIFKTAKGAVELGKKAVPIVKKIPDIQTLNTIGNITTAESQIADLQTRIANAHNNTDPDRALVKATSDKLDELKKLAKEIDSMPKTVTNVFGSAAKMNEINVKVVGVLKTIPDELLAAMKGHTDPVVKTFGEQLAKAVNFAKTDATALAGAKLLIEIFRKVK